MKSLSQFYKKEKPEFMKYVAVVKQILQDEKDLQDIVQLVGKDSLGEDQKLKLEIARIIREDFLQQNGFSDHDFTCPLVKTVGMLKCIVTFYDEAMKAITASTGGDLKLTWNTIAKRLSKQYIALTDMKFVNPKLEEHEIATHYNDLAKEITTAFRDLVANQDQ